MRKKDPHLFMAQKSFSNASKYTIFIISNSIHAHLDGRGWYMDLPKGNISHFELELYWDCQAFAFQLPIGTQVDLPIVELCDSKQVVHIVNEQVAMVS